MSAEHDHHSEAHGHHEQSFVQKYVFSVDHKVIGIQYTISALFFLLFGFCLMMMIHKLCTIIILKTAFN